MQRSWQSIPSAPQSVTQVPPEQICSGPQAWPQVPQLAMLVESETQFPPQLVKPGAQESEQAPLTQAWPLPQAWLQAPQLVTLVLVSTQLRLHWAKPVGQADALHWPLRQIWSGAQAMSQSPQWLALEARSVQAPSQLASAGQASVQVPFEQTVPSWQTVLTVPQLLESVAGFTQLVVGPSAEKNWPGTSGPAQFVAQLPFTHTSPAGQAFPQLPQWRLEVLSETQRPSHSVVVDGQALVQVPPTQT